MADWVEIKLGKVADLINGFAFKSKDFTQSGIPVLKIKNVKPQLIKTDDLSFVSENTIKGKEKWKVKKGDILITMSGNRADGSPDSWVGKVAQFNKDGSYYLNQRVSIIKPIVDFINPTFLAYQLSSWDYQLELINLANSSGGQANISPEIVKGLDILLPSLSEQERIAEVLSSLDDKIDLLHRNNKTLEQLAETLFRQWFVEEAETKPVKHFGKIICGKTPSKNNSNFFNGPIPFLKIPDMHGKAFVFKTTDSLTEEGKQSQSNKTIPPFSISVSCIATVGLVTINAFECQTNQQINSIVPNEKNYRYYLYNYFKSITDDLIQRASSGSVTHNLNTSDFSNIEIPFFSDDLFSSFDDVVDPLYQKVFINEQQIQQLETLRDTLLPKLMSGAVRVEE